MTTSSWADRPAPSPAPATSHGRPADGDLLSWLGFELGQGADEPRFPWSRPWPTGRRGAA